MYETAGHLPAALVSADAPLEREFERRVQENADLAVRVAFSVLRNREDAEEVAQEAFARLYSRFRQLGKPDQFRAWIVRVAWRLAIDRWRADRRRLSREQSVGEAQAAASPEQLAADAQRASRLWQAIEVLPEKLRLVIVLSAIEGHGIHDVARLLQIPEGTVKSRLFLARKALVESLRCLADDSSTR
jgi:RNA polymerase sigma-70 factor, ECF subfamily